MRGSVVFLVFMILAVPGTTPARTWFVDSYGTGDAPTLVAGIDSAGYGDTVMVAPGTYYSDSASTQPGRWIVMKDGLTLISEQGPEVTTLVRCPNTNGIAYTVTFDHVTESTLRGFTIRSWEAGECDPGGGEWSGAIECWSSRATIEDNIIPGKFRWGIAVDGPNPVPGTPEIRNNSITGCIVLGIECENWCSPLIEGNTITDNGTGLYMKEAQAVVNGNVIAGNRWDGIQCEEGCPAVITRNTITGNAHFGLYINTPASYGPVFADGSVPGCGNSIYGNTDCDLVYTPLYGSGSISVPFTYWGDDCPDFVGTVCISGEAVHVPWSDADHTEILWSCPEATEPSTWGIIKSMYR